MVNKINKKIIGLMEFFGLFGGFFDVIDIGETIYSKVEKTLELTLDSPEKERKIIKYFSEQTKGAVRICDIEDILVIGSESIYAKLAYLTIGVIKNEIGYFEKWNSADVVENYIKYQVFKKIVEKTKDKELGKDFIKFLSENPCIYDRETRTCSDQHLEEAIKIARLTGNESLIDTLLNYKYYEAHFFGNEKQIDEIKKLMANQNLCSRKTFSYS